MEERDQTYDEMMADLTNEELELCRNEPADPSSKIAMGRKIRAKQKETKKQEINMLYA